MSGIGAALACGRVWRQIQALLWYIASDSKFRMIACSAKLPQNRRWRMLALMVACLATIVAPRTVLAQGPAARTTVDGVYTSVQATKGADIYAMLCQSCHSAESHTGAPFRNKWVGKPLGELFAYISSEMPKTEPGSLSADEYTVVLAYILKMNGMPAGRRSLVADASALDSIRIDLPKKGVTGGSSRQR